jgi:hypothetical protein
VGRSRDSKAGGVRSVDLLARRQARRHREGRAQLRSDARGAHCRLAAWLFDQRPGSADNQALVEHINRAAPDVLFVNMGMPLQEFWLYHHWLLLNVRVAVAAGALVDHAAGHVRRPPQWVANLWLEWAVRLAVEPRRLWRRYLIGLPMFGAVPLREMILRRETASMMPLSKATSPSSTELR